MSSCHRVRHRHYLCTTGRRKHIWPTPFDIPKGAIERRGCALHGREYPLDEDDVDSIERLSLARALELQEKEKALDEHAQATRAGYVSLEAARKMWEDLG